MRSLLCLALAASTAFAADTHKLTRVYEKIATERPIAVVIPDDGSGREFLALQRGKILILPKDEQGTEAKTFLDLSPRGMEAKAPERWCMPLSPRRGAKAGFLPDEAAQDS